MSMDQSDFSPGPAVAALTAITVDTISVATLEGVLKLLNDTFEGHPPPVCSPQNLPEPWVVMVGALSGDDQDIKLKVFELLDECCLVLPPGFALLEALSLTVACDKTLEDFERRAERSLAERAAATGEPSTAPVADTGAGSGAGASPAEPSADGGDDDDNNDSDNDSDGGTYTVRKAALGFIDTAASNFPDQTCLTLVPPLTSVLSDASSPTAALESAVVTTGALAAGGGMTAMLKCRDLHPLILALETNVQYNTPLCQSSLAWTYQFLFKYYAFTVDMPRAQAIQSAVMQFGFSEHPGVAHAGLSSVAEILSIAVDRPDAEHTFVPFAKNFVEELLPRFHGLLSRETESLLFLADVLGTMWEAMKDHEELKQMNTPLLDVLVTHLVSVLDRVLGRSPSPHMTAGETELVAGLLDAVAMVDEHPSFVDPIVGRLLPPVVRLCIANLPGTGDVYYSLLEMVGLLGKAASFEPTLAAQPGLADAVKSIVSMPVCVSNPATGNSQLAMLGDCVEAGHFKPGEGVFADLAEPVGNAVATALVTGGLADRSLPFYANGMWTAHLFTLQSPAIVEPFASDIIAVLRAELGNRHRLNAKVVGNTAELLASMAVALDPSPPRDADMLALLASTAALQPASEVTVETAKALGVLLSRTPSVGDDEPQRRLMYHVMMVACGMSQMEEEKPGALEAALGIGREMERLMGSARWQAQLEALPSGFAAAFQSNSN